jgi:2-polyprenyl-3-methyl-5-hydroxy-6-metoxy-1,4-benzoquinol methylase
VTVNIHHRDTCRLCESPNVELVVALEPIPLAENYTTDSATAKGAPRFPVDLYMCADCGHVQQLDVVDSESLWENYTYYSGDAKGMPEHFNQVAANVLHRCQPPPGSLVIDIGSNDGSLLRPFKEAGLRVLGIDPAKAVAQQATAGGIPTIPDLMSLDLARKIREQYGPAHVICAFNVFAHADNLGEMAESVRTMLAPDGLFFFEAQYLLDIIDGVLIATIFHEHMSHHSVNPMIRFLERHGLELIAAERAPIQHGALIGTVQVKHGKRAVEGSVRELLTLEAERRLGELDTLRQFGNRLKQLKERVSGLVQEWKRENAAIAGYGAARSGPTLISQLGLDGMIEYIVDDHPQKVGKYSSGDGIPIVPTAELCRRMPDYTIILAWVHAKKIIESNPEYLDKGGDFIVLCPELRVVSKARDVKIWSCA